VNARSDVLAVIVGFDNRLAADDRSGRVGVIMEQIVQIGELIMEPCLECECCILHGASKSIFSFSNGDRDGCGWWQMSASVARAAVVIHDCRGLCARRRRRRLPCR